MVVLFDAVFIAVAVSTNFDADKGFKGLVVKNGRLSDRSNTYRFADAAEVALCNFHSSRRRVN